MGACSTKPARRGGSTAAANAAMAMSPERISAILTASPIADLSAPTRERLSSKEDAFAPRKGADNYEQLLAKARKMRETGRSQYSVELSYRAPEPAPGGPAAPADAPAVAEPGDAENAILAALSDWGATLAAGVPEPAPAEPERPLSPTVRGSVSRIVSIPEGDESAPPRWAEPARAEPALTATVVDENTAVVEGCTSGGALVQWALTADPGSGKRSSVLRVTVGDRVATATCEEGGGAALLTSAMAEALEEGRERARSYLSETAEQRRIALEEMERSVMASLDAALTRARHSDAKPGLSEIRARSSSSAEARTSLF